MLRTSGTLTYKSPRAYRANAIGRLKDKLVRAREMDQWLRALAAFAEDPGSIPSTHARAQTYMLAKLS